jgi:hypothetical protein
MELYEQRPNTKERYVPKTEYGRPARGQKPAPKGRRARGRIYAPGGRFQSPEGRRRMIKCETHLHAAGGSPCASAAPAEIAADYARAGYKAVCVTNHYMKSLFEYYYPAGGEREKIAYYISIYRAVKAECKKRGIKTFLGMELNPQCTNTETVEPVQEYLCYGLTEKFLYDNPRLYDLTQKEQFALLSASGGAMFQAHPFRGYCTRGDPKYMHGAECFNGHAGHDSHNDLAGAFAAENGLLRLSGSDYHDAGTEIRGGVWLPEEIGSDKEFAAYLLSGTARLIRGGA